MSAPRPTDDGARWLAVEALFHEALVHPAATRDAVLAGTDAATRAEVEALLAAHERRGTVDALIDDVMAPLLARPTGDTHDAHDTHDTGAPRDTTHDDASRPATTPVADPHEPALPVSPVPRFRLLARLGGGGMGVVYRARDERLGREVALKFLPPHLSADPAAKRRFVVEARAAAALAHPNLCTVHEIGDTDDGQLYIVMTCYDGETLDRRIARAPLAPAEALHVAGEIARGLHAAHERGIVHRDVKPANVVLTADGRVIILDFGIAKLADVAVTQTAGAVGTAAYMSPEQAFGEAVDHRTDLWALGVVLYEMLAGVRPFRGPTAHATIAAALTVDPEPVASLRPDVPAAVDALLRTLLAKSPAERPASAEAVVAALAAAAAPEAPRAAARPRATGGTLARAGERRQVTVLALVADGHVALAERLGPDVAAARLETLAAAVRGEAERHEATVVRHGDAAWHLAFGTAAAHEDDAVRAVRVALALQERARALAAPGAPGAALRLRAGVHAGAAITHRAAGDAADVRVVGAPAEIATRLANAAAPDTVLVSPETHRLVAPFVFTTPATPVTLADGAAAVVPHRVLGPSDVRSRLEGAAPHALTPFVGRTRERAALRAHLDAARAGAGRCVALVGEAGAGKSRLVHELRAEAEAAGMRLLRGHCDVHGGGTPFGPFVEVAREALGVERTGSVSPLGRVAAAVEDGDGTLAPYLPLHLALLGIDAPAHPVPEHLRGELFQAAMLEAIAALCTVTARRTPTLLVLEDWHWADDGSRGALRQLAEVLEGVPLLVLVTSRPEGAGEIGAPGQVEALHLAPLDAAATAAIAGAVLGAAHVPAELAARLHERTGGNPFFLEEVCEALREAGTLAVHDGEAALADEATGAHVPATVQGVLRTRIDRLDGDARDALRIAAVVGRDFTRGVLEDVATALGTLAGGALAAALDRLKASGLVQQAALLPEPAYRFKHALTQEVAYDSLLEHQRTALHAAVGRAIATRYAGRLDAHAERLAHHFALAGEWEAAVTHGLRAADRAEALSRNADALAMLERVETWVRRLAEAGDAGTGPHAASASRDRLADVLLRQERLCESLGLRTRQHHLADTLITLLAPHGPSVRLAQAYLRLGDACTLRRRFEAAERALETALRIAAELGDGAGERHALRSLALLRSHEGRHAEARDTVERVLALGRAAGDTRAEAGDLCTLANVHRAMGRPDLADRVLRDALARSVPADSVVRHAAMLNVMGAVQRELGDHDAALHYFREVAAHGLDERHPVHASHTLPAIAHLLLQRGDVEAALDTYRRALEINRRARYADGAAHAARSLGEALLGLGRHADAVAPLGEAAALFAQLEDARNEALMWRRLAGAHDTLGDARAAATAWGRVAALLAGDEEALDVRAEAAEGLARAARRTPGHPPLDVAARYQEALALAVRAGDARRELAVRNALGIVHWERGAYADALPHYEAALRLCRETGDRVHEGLILNSLGATLHRLRRWDEARHALSEGARAAEASDEPLLRAHALGVLAETCVASGRLDEALASASESLALRRALGDPRGVAMAHVRLAAVHAARGDEAAAREAALSARAHAGDDPDPALVAALAALPAALRSPVPTGTTVASHPHS